jgi:voltage-gated sodium channel
VVYFVSFILLGTMIMLNLLIGVIVNGMSEAREETEDAARAARGGLPSVPDELADLRRQVDALAGGIAALQRRIESDSRRGPPQR